MIEDFTVIVFDQLQSSPLSHVQVFLSEEILQTLVICVNLALMYISKLSPFFGRVRIGALVSLLFSSMKLFSQSAIHSNFLFFLVSTVNGEVILEKFSTNFL